jgi:hypothetical protein
VASLACESETSATCLDKVEQLYAYFSTTGEDTRVFGSDKTPYVPNKRQSVIGMPVGARILHPTRGYGVMVDVGGNHPGKPITVEFENGEVHHYSLASLKRFKVMSSRSLQREPSVRKEPPASQPAHDFERETSGKAATALPGSQPTHDVERETSGEAAIALPGSQPTPALGAVRELVSGEAAIGLGAQDARAAAARQLDANGGSPATVASAESPPAAVLYPHVFWSQTPPPPAPSHYLRPAVPPVELRIAAPDPWLWYTTTETQPALPTETQGASLSESRPLQLASVHADTRRDTIAAEPLPSTSLSIIAHPTKLDMCDSGVQTTTSRLGNTAVHTSRVLTDSPPESPRNTQLNTARHEHELSEAANASIQRTAIQRTADLGFTYLRPGSQEQADYAPGHPIPYQPTRPGSPYQWPSPSRLPTRVDLSGPRMPALAPYSLQSQMRPALRYPPSNPAPDSKLPVTAGRPWATTTSTHPFLAPYTFPSDDAGRVGPHHGSLPTNTEVRSLY